MLVTKRQPNLNSSSEAGEQTHATETRPNNTIKTIGDYGFSYHMKIYLWKATDMDGDRDTCIRARL